MEEKNPSTVEKKIRFRQPAKVLFRQDSKIEDLLRNERKDNGDMNLKSEKFPSLFSFLQVEVTRDYLLENDEERFSARREKIYSFMRIPKEVEKFMQYGIMQCTDSFLFVYTFLPLRVVLALWALVTRPFSKCFGLGDRRNKRILTAAEICDLLKAIILIFSTVALWSVDTNMMYHMIKSQSVIKLYIFYNMLEIGDRLFSSFGQDTIDALFWTATEPRGRKREHLGVIPHLLFALIYVNVSVLRDIARYRSEKKNIFYLDKTWLKEGHSVQKIWQDKNIQSSRQIEGVSTGFKIPAGGPAGKGRRLIITHIIGSESGFVNGGLLKFESKSTKDYHEEMTADVFEEYFEQMIRLPRADLMHSSLVLFQATTLNVAVNANNKALLTIMMSNNFVELKGSVFKKFDKNNLFQVSCSDVRERFHLMVLLFIVILQTMKEYSWKIDIFWVLMVDCVGVLGAEVLVDWIKHAFITRFNELHLDVYKDYRTSLAYDLAQTRQKHAFSDHSDLVARRMGFIPIPLGVVMIRVLLTSINIYNIPAVIIVITGYVCLWSWKILNSIFILGKACRFIAQHKLERTTQNSPVNSSESKEKLKDTATSPLHPVSDQPRKGVLLRNGFPPLDVKENELIVNAPPGDLGASAIFANSTVDLKNASLNEELLKVNEEEIRIEQLTDEILTRSVPDIKKELSGDEMVSSKTEVESLKKSESEPNLINMTDSQGKEL